MNNLSWLIYLADIADNLDWFFWLIMLAGVLGGAIWLVAAHCMGEDGASKDDWKVWRKIGLRALLPCFVLGVILGSIVPSKTTVYAIAASEMGETALNTQTGGKAVKALNAWLDRQIAGETESKPEEK